MSWMIRTDQHPLDQISSAIDKTEPGRHVSKDQLEQIRSAKSAAKKLLEDNVVGGRDGDLYVATLSGHAGDDGESGIEGISVQITATRALDTPEVASGRSDE